MKVAIAGYGVEGESSYRYYKALGNDVAIADQRQDISLPEGVEAILGEDAFNRLDEFDLIIRSPGIAPKKLPYKDKVWSATNEFFSNCPAPIVGVTGTKGKGTTSSLIASILTSGGKKAHLVGNIGMPALDILPDIKSDDIVVFELSSFQLWDLKKSPQVAVVLTIEPDHLDVHADYAEYIAAKAHIAENETTLDRVVFNVSNQAATAIAGLSIGQRLPYPSQKTAHVKSGYFFYDDTKLCSIDDLQLPGKHNQDNACAAITAIWPWVKDPQYIGMGLKSFAGLSHRLQLVKEVNGVKYYDDSIATTPGSAIAALRAFDEPKVIILGGSNKGAKYDEIIDLCKKTGSKVVAIGQTGQQIYELCKRQGVECKRVEGKMKEVVVAAHAMAQPGNVVILSPASASFDQYKNYVERGDYYEKAIIGLEGETT